MTKHTYTTGPLCARTHTSPKNGWTLLFGSLQWRVRPLHSSDFWFFIAAIPNYLFTGMTIPLLIGIWQGFVPGTAICAAQIADTSFASVVE